MKKILLLSILFIVGCEGVLKPEDCADVAGGTAVEDCFGVCDGLAAIDECGLCTGGTTNLTPNYLKDECGVCGGDGELDVCGICNGDSTYCFGCMDTTACNYMSHYTFSQNSSCIYAYENFNCDGNCLNDSDNDNICDEYEIEMEFVSVPAGEYFFGEGDTVKLINYDFEIGKFEVTTGEYTKFLNAQASRGSITEQHDKIYDNNILLIDIDDSYIYYLEYQHKFIIIGNSENFPVNGLTWYGAKAFADYYGYKLPNENEWEKAARGNSSFDFPWGENIDDVLSDNVNYSNSGDPFDGGNWISSQTDELIYNATVHVCSTPIGFYNGENYEGFQTTDSPSPYGAYDMSGNVKEWTSSPYTVSDAPEYVAYKLKGASCFNSIGNHEIWRFYQQEIDYGSKFSGFRVLK